MSVSSGKISGGTTPQGTTTEEQAAKYVRGMFAEVAPRYDLLNHLLSANIDKYWRNRTVSRLKQHLSKPGVKVLDICCGTGDLTILLEKAVGAPVLGSDFCHPMLTEASRKILKGRLGSPLFEADGLSLPLKDASLDVITVAFGFRNFANYRQGIEEMRRVLKPGGVAAVLEFTQPPSRVLRSAYNFYSRRVLPVIGGMLSGSKDAYTYLPESVKKFPDAPLLAEEMSKAGFAKVEFEYMTFGIVALHLAWR